MTFRPSPFESASGVVVYATKNSGDSNNRYQVDSDGVASWGSGSGAVDVSISRGGADQLDLAAGDSFHVLSGHVRVGGTGGTGDAYIDLDDGSSVTAGGSGEVRFRSNAGVFEVSENGAAFAAPGGGGVTDLQGAYDGGDDILVVSGTPVLLKLSSIVTPPTTSADTALMIIKNFSIGLNVEMSLISGASASAFFNFGNAADEDAFYLEYSSIASQFNMYHGTAQSLTITSNGVIINNLLENAVDFRIKSDTVVNFFLADVGNERVVMQLDGGSLPGIGANTAFVFAKSLLGAANVEISLIAGVDGNATINFGDASDENAGFLTYDNTQNDFSISVASGTQVMTLSSTEVVINDAGIATLDLRVEGDSLDRLIATDASGATECVILITDTAPDLQTMDRGVYWGSVTTEPTAAPAGGAFLYVDALGNFQEMNEAAEIGELAVVERREWWWQVNANDTTAEAVGLAAPTATGSAAQNDGATGPFIQYDTSSSINSDAGWNGASTGIRADWNPVMTAYVATDAVITSVRIWVGMFSADPMGAADPSLHIAAFRYDTVADGTAFWRCVTEDGTTISVTITTIAIAVDTPYNLRIDVRDKTSIKFYINGILAATKGVNLPTTTTDLQVHAELRNLTAASRFFNLNKVHMTTK